VRLVAPLAAAQAALDGPQVLQTHVAHQEAHAVTHQDLDDLAPALVTCVHR
jgi:hypothetical protein